MLRGGFTLSIGWIVMIVVPILMGIWFGVFKKDEGKEASTGPYVDGKLSKKNNVILWVFIGVVVLMVVLAAILTPMMY